MPAHPVLVALLGSSNLTVGLPAALQHLPRLFRDRPLNVFVAYGPGRSYEIDRGSLGVRFRSLSRCDLLPAIEQAREKSPSAKAYALLTDIGNDLMHGVTARSLTGRVRHVADRLNAIGARVAVTSLPVEGIAALSPRGFHLARTLIYPASRTTHDDVVGNLNAVQRDVQGMDARCEIQLLSARREWYSPDGCHIRPSRAGQAFRRWLDQLAGIDSPTTTAGNPSLIPLAKEGLYLHCRPACRLFRATYRPHDARPFTIAPGVTVQAF